jgi:outer membrane protein
MMYIMPLRYRFKLLTTLTISSAILLMSNVQGANLLSLYNEAIISDPQLLAANAEIEVGEARERQAFAGLLPQASASGSISRNRYEQTEPINYTGRRYNISLRQPLFDGESWYSYKGAEHDTNKQRALFIDAKSTLAFDLTSRYLDALISENALTLVNSELESVAGQLQLLYSKQKRQLAVKTDVLDVEARLQILKVEVIEAQNNVAITREGLTQLVNRPLADETLDDFLDRIPYQPIERSLNSWVQYAYDNSKLYQALQQDVQAVEKRIRQRRSGHLPKVELQLNAQSSNIGSENIQTSRTKSYTAGVSISIPLYSGGRTKASIRESYAQLDIARQKVEQLRRELQKEVRESLLNTSASWSRITAGRLAIIASTKSHEAMKQGFKYGTVTVVDVLDALRKKIESELTFKRAQYDFVRNYMKLQHISGSLDKSMLEKIKIWQSNNG